MGYMLIVLVLIPDGLCANGLGPRALSTDGLSKIQKLIWNFFINHIRKGVSRVHL